MIALSNIVFVTMIYDFSTSGEACSSAKNQQKVTAIYKDTKQVSYCEVSTVAPYSKAPTMAAYLKASTQDFRITGVTEDSPCQVLRTPHAVFTGFKVSTSAANHKASNMAAHFKASTMAVISKTSAPAVHT